MYSIQKIESPEPPTADGKTLELRQGCTSKKFYRLIESSALRDSQEAEITNIPGESVGEYRAGLRDPFT